MSESVNYKIRFLVNGDEDIYRVNTTLEKISKKRVKDPFRDLPKSLSRLRTELSRYKDLQEKSFRTDHIRKYNSLIDATQKKIKKLEKSTATCGTKTEGFFSKLKNNFGITKGAIGAGALVMLGKQAAQAGMEAVKASAQFETFGVTLKTMLGSTGAARERMAEYTDIARVTPFELRQVVEAGNQLQAIGRYSRENLTMLGDLAAASGKPVEQVMNAYAKLSTGQKGEAVNMFRDLLISTDDWAEATGKGVKKNGELMASHEEMIKALPKILGKKGFFGMMEQQAKTTQGRMSNLADSVDMLKVAVGDHLKPAYDSFLKSSTGLVESMTKMIEVPVSEKIAREKAGLNALVGVITNTNTGEEQRLGMLRQIKQEYPEFLGSIDLEKVKNDELLTKLNKVNAAYEEKIRLASIKSIKDEGKAALDEKKAERDKLMLLRESFNSYKQLETYFGKDAYTDAVSKAGGNGLSFDDYLETTVLSAKEQEYKKTQSPEALEWLLKYREYKGVKAQVNKSGGFFKAQNNLDSKLEKLNADINLQQAYVSGTERKQKEQQNKITLSQAMGVDMADKDTFAKLFGTDEMAKEFKALRQKASQNKGSLTDDDWARLAGFVSGDLMQRKNSVTPNPNGINTLNGIEQATNTITGGGRQVKNINFNIGSLVGENTNNFTPGDDPADADDFMRKLIDALKLVMNDVNYAN